MRIRNDWPIYTGVVTRDIQRLWGVKAADWVMLLQLEVHQSCTVLGEIAPVDFLLPIAPEVLIGFGEMLAAHETARS